MLIIEQKLITNTKNFIKGRKDGGINGIVLHSEGASGRRANPDAASLYTWFQNNGRRVSAHYYVKFNGQVEQYVLEENGANQAGNATFNLNTLGIEHQDEGQLNAYTPLQYEMSATLVAYLCQRYQIPALHAERNSFRGILIHKEVPNKQTACPRRLDWSRIIGQAQALVATGQLIEVTIINKLKLNTDQPLLPPSADPISE